MSNWRSHPKLASRLQPERGDDLEVIIHDGDPPLCGRPGEVAWVRIVGVDGDVFRAMVLTQPTQLKSVTKHEEILFIVPSGGKYPIQVRPAYLAERATWRLLLPCGECGLTELFSPPSEIAAHSFPHLFRDGVLLPGSMFTTRCGYCGGPLVVRVKRAKLGA